MLLLRLVYHNCVEVSIICSYDEHILFEGNIVVTGGKAVCMYLTLKTLDTCSDSLISENKTRGGVYNTRGVKELY